MLDKVLVGTAVWLVSNPTGRKVAQKGFAVLKRIGGYAVNAMPKELSGICNGIDDFINTVTKDDKEGGFGNV